MPPITLKLDAYVYNYLFTLRNQAVHTIIDEFRSKQQLFDNQSMLILAELKLSDPKAILFSKKGKAVRFSLAQAVAIHKAFQFTLMQQVELPEYLYTLYSQIDQALTDYSPVYGYKG
ncbi:hypothetical protein [Spirosoma aerolatum]|uniref:hypothetical protein n=1 Tax=Spirosoma aerolatum TaxID=1211326 RepID=UPI0009AD38BD|nr:hypothetical protein [Spirosoma aerolatum]